MSDKPIPRFGKAACQELIAQMRGAVLTIWSARTKADQDRIVNQLNNGLAVLSKSIGRPRKP